MPEQPPTRYPESWKPRGAPDFEPEPEPESVLRPLEMELAAAAPPAPAEALQMAVDSYIAALSPEEFAQLVARTRG